MRRLLVERGFGGCLLSLFRRHGAAHRYQLFVGVRVLVLILGQQARHGNGSLGSLSNSLLLGSYDTLIDEAILIDCAVLLLTV